MSKPMIHVSQLSKSYEIHHRDSGILGAIKGLFTKDIEIKMAVNDISFSIEEGESVAYIGGNGAGKSTTIKMLTGILTPTSGQIFVNGISPHRNRIQNAQHVGVVFGQRTQLIWDITPMDTYQLLKHIYEISEIDFKRRLDYFIDELSLQHLLARPVRQLSLGERMRCEFLAAFLHNPKVIYLDEPTIGLDVAVKARIRQFIRDVNREYGTTIILTSHDMSDIEGICNRFMIIDEGKLIYDGNYQNLQKKFGQQRIIELELEHADRFEVPSVFGSFVHRVPSDEGIIKLAFDSEQISASEVSRVVMSLYTVRDMKILEPKIEHIVQHILEKRM